MTWLPTSIQLLPGGIGQLVVLVDVDRLPGVVDPDVADGLSGLIARLDHVVGQGTLLGLVLVLHWVSAGAPSSQAEVGGGGGVNARGGQRC